MATTDTYATSAVFDGVSLVAAIAGLAVTLDLPSRAANRATINAVPAVMGGLLALHLSGLPTMSVLVSPFLDLSCATTMMMYNLSVVISGALMGLAAFNYLFAATMVVVVSWVGGSVFSGSRIAKFAGGCAASVVIWFLQGTIGTVFHMLAPITHSATGALLVACGLERWLVPDHTHRCLSISMNCGTQNTEFTLIVAMVFLSGIIVRGIRWLGSAGPTTGSASAQPAPGSSPSPRTFFSVFGTSPAGDAKTKAAGTGCNTPAAALFGPVSATPGTTGSPSLSTGSPAPGAAQSHQRDGPTTEADPVVYDTMDAADIRGILRSRGLNCFGPVHELRERAAKSHRF